MRSRFTVFGLVLVVGMGGIAAAETAPQRLFHIERNTNANIVVYDALVQGDGSLSEDDPIDVYWLRLAEDGERKGLKWIERKMAYGVDVEEHGGNSLVCKMKADIGRLVAVEKVGEAYRALIEIDGRRTLLEKVFIFAKEGGGLPTVEYIELFGKNPETDEEMYEKYLP